MDQNTRIHLDFAIVCYQRSGSHFLSSCLESHPLITGIGEFVTREERPPFPAKVDLIGGIVMYNQWEQAQPIATFSRVIHLLRNPRDTALSNERNNMGKKLQGAVHRAHFQQGETLPPIYEVSEKEVRKRELVIRDFQARFKKLLASTDHIELNYEELTGNESRSEMPEASARRILNFLELPEHRLVTALIKTGPVGQRG